MNSKGQTLIVVLGILVIFMITIPFLTNLVRQEALWTVKQKKTTVAFHAAEAGIDRGVWKLRESASNWDTAFDGGTIAGYANDVVYDMYETTGNSKLFGQYRINISQGPGAGQITVLSKGRDPTSNELRAVEVIFSRAAISASMHSDGGIQYKPNLQVHWGPVVTFTSIDQSPSDWYPRKFSKGQIVGRDTEPNLPNSDNKEWWSFKDLGDPPQVNLAFYKQEAKNCAIPTSSGGGTLRKKTGSAAAVADPAGSGFYPAASNNGGIRFFGGYKLTSTSAVIYTDGTMDFLNGAFLDIKAAVAEGNVDFNGDGATYVATVSSGAAEEYVKHEEVNGPGWPGKGLATYPVTSCGMHGFLYCGGNFSTGGGGAKMVGVIKIIGTVSVNTFTIFFDDAVANAIKLANTAVSQTSWKEVKAVWP